MTRGEPLAPAPRFAVAMLGARMHYAVPRILHGAGMLEHLYTDLVADQGWPRVLRRVPGIGRAASVQRILGRAATGVPRERTTAFSRFGWMYAYRLRRSRTEAGALAAYLWAGKRFCELVLRQGLDGADAVFTYNTAGLELLGRARAEGLRTVMEQTIAPRPVERALLEEEHARFPGWQAVTDGGPAEEELVARERGEWDHSDVILCGSEFVRDGVAACGGPAERCVVVPYGVDLRFRSAQPQLRSPGPLRVLTVGAVGLRKGAPYVLAAARRAGARMHFRMVGPIELRPEGVEHLRERVELVGPVPRSQILAHFAWADVFLLPSVCEGSATVTYEALMRGIPVITTPNAGSIVRDGVDGFVVPLRDVDAMIERLNLLATDPALLAALSANAVAGAPAASYQAYSARLLSALRPSGHS